MFKKKIITLLITLITILVFFSGCNEKSNSGITIYVDDDGGADFTSIQSAIDVANPGDTIYVYSGFYNESLHIAKSINLVGSSAIDTFILPKDVKSNNNCTIFLNADKCTIRDFDISFEGTKFDNSGIKISTSNNSILNNTFSNFLYGIVFTSDSTDSVIIGNNVSYNRISECTDGIFSQDNLRNNMFFNNSITNNQEGIEFSSAVNNSIIANEIVSNSLYGIFITSNSDGNTISYNYIKSGRYGIRFKGVSYNEIFANKVVECETGLYSCCGSGENTLYYNSLINNTIQASDAFHNFWDNGVYGNYWSDYSTLNPNATQTEDVWSLPYFIVDGGNKDSFPLVNPVV